MVSEIVSQRDSASFTTHQANLVEIFSAIQGEGLNVGTRQLFIRFGGCDLRCIYCDSAHTWRPKFHCRIEQTAGERDFQTHTNPISIPQLLAWGSHLNCEGIHDSISLTGGEPLLAWAFLQECLPHLRATLTLPIYLETGGHHPQALQLLAPWLDSVGMDIKLPSVSGESHWAAHQACLEICQASGLTVFCKVIISGTTTTEDLEQAVNLIARVNPKIPLILQPITPVGTGRRTPPPTPAQVLAWQHECRRHLQEVRVIPQTHKFLNQL